MTENQIRNIVEEYLKKTFFYIPFQMELFPFRYNTKKEYPIQIGSYQGRADLVLLANDKLIAIVECKRLGVVGQGHEQLHSYLCASQARLGIFANNPRPDDWVYYEKTGINTFSTISRDEFQKSVRTQRRSQFEIEKRIQEQTEQYIKDESVKRATLPKIQERTDTLIETEAKKRVTENAIHGAVAQELHAQITLHQNQIESFKQKLSDKAGCATLGWVLFFISLFILMAIVGG